VVVVVDQVIASAVGTVALAEVVEVVYAKLPAVQVIGTDLRAVKVLQVTRLIAMEEMQEPIPGEAGAEDLTITYQTRVVMVGRA